MIRKLRKKFILAAVAAVFLVLLLLIGAGYTGITGKKINPKYEGWIHGAALILLLALMAFLMVKDVFMIINR